MQTKKITTILEGDNFSEDLENYILTEIDNETVNHNPFTARDEGVSNKILLKSIICCTVILANIIYLLHRG